MEAALRAHAAQCPICSEVAEVALAFDGALEQTRAHAAIPNASRVWWRAQLRARNEAARAAGRPIAVAQVIALGCTLALLGACFGATSAWFQSLVKRGVTNASKLDLAAILASMPAPLAGHGLLILGLVAAVFLVPTLVFVALGRD